MTISGYLLDFFDYYAYTDLQREVIDRFGKEVMMIPTDEDHFTVNVSVHVSSHFFGWLFSVGAGVKVIGPDDIVEQMKEELQKLSKQYNE